MGSWRLVWLAESCGWGQVTYLVRQCTCCYPPEQVAFDWWVGQAWLCHSPSGRQPQPLFTLPRLFGSATVLHNQCSLAAVILHLVTSQNTRLREPYSSNYFANSLLCISIWLPCAIHILYIWLAGRTPEEITWLCTWDLLEVVGKSYFPSFDHLLFMGLFFFLALMRITISVLLWQLYQHHYACIFRHIIELWSNWISVNNRKTTG